MTTNKPEVFEVYRTKQGTLENVVLLADYEALQAECEKLRKDAERYRWLREQEASDNAICVLDCGEWVKPAMVIALAYSSAEDCDAAIDTAMQRDSPC